MAEALATLIDAFDEPLLVLDGLTVVEANHPARTLFGGHILGDNVRLVLRHPAAAAVVAGEDDGPVSLSGIGGYERAWELSGGAIGPGRRLLRLSDRSGVRATERMRVDFVANASHELRTPLAALIGFIEALGEANGADEAETRARFLTIMAGEAWRMQRLIDDLMSLSRIEADRFARPREHIDLAAVVERVCTELAAAGETRVACKTVAATIEGDAGQLSQLLHNIIGNALKYGQAGTPVEIAVTAADGEARLAVRDQGEGVAPEHLPRLTERFYRVDPGRSRAGGGTGLGLAIVKHIVERHRGRLDIASRVGIGTTVSVVFPLADELS